LDKEDSSLSKSTVLKAIIPPISPVLEFVLGSIFTEWQTPTESSARAGRDVLGSFTEQFTWKIYDKWLRKRKK